MLTVERPPSATFIRLQERLRGAVGRAISEYHMIGDGDTVMVCLSGGKDSHALLSILMDLQRRAPVSFRLIAVNLDQKQPGFPEHVLPEYLCGLGVQFHIEQQDTYAVVKRLVPEWQTLCSLCSRLRRGVLYRTAKALGANKIALGHHRDDIIETMFLNMFYGGRLKAMPPKLVTDDGHHIVIRPLAYCTEKDLATYARHMAYPIIPCDLCGSQDNLKRAAIKEWLKQQEREFPGRVDNIFLALQSVTPSHLADTALFDFAHLAPSQQANPEGDTQFDPDTLERGALRLSTMEDRRIHFVKAGNSDKIKD